MTLDTENAKLFFKLYLPILDYVNLKCHVLENDEKFNDISKDNIKKISEDLLKNYDTDLEEIRNQIKASGMLTEEEINTYFS